jgi:hypothetical protein
MGQIPGSMHDALNAEGAAVPVEEQMAIKWPSDLDAADQGKFWSSKVAANAKAWLFSDGLDGLLHGKEIPLGDIKVGILKIPAVLLCQVLLSSVSDGDFETHA